MKVQLLILHFFRTFFNWKFQNKVIYKYTNSKGNKYGIINGKYLVTKVEHFTFDLSLTFPSKVERKIIHTQKFQQQQKIILDR